ncbi:hypothetical protein EDD86DRAFT_245958 [Gorgonomyces haynaldii]|nr:hypothetical protein EDD86DRAFT_245958 [Gorgonomyces haynaldii]
MQQWLQVSTNNIEKATDNTLPVEPENWPTIRDWIVDKDRKKHGLALGLYIAKRYPELIQKDLSGNKSLKLSSASLCSHLALNGHSILAFVPSLLQIVKQDGIDLNGKLQHTKLTLAASQALTRFWSTKLILDGQDLEWMQDYVAIFLIYDTRNSFKRLYLADLLKHDFDQHANTAMQELALIYSSLSMEQIEKHLKKIRTKSNASVAIGCFLSVLKQDDVLLVLKSQIGQEIITETVSKCISSDKNQIEQVTLFDAIVAVLYDQRDQLLDLVFAQINRLSESIPNLRSFGPSMLLKSLFGLKPRILDWLLLQIRVPDTVDQIIGLQILRDLFPLGFSDLEQANVLNHALGLFYSPHALVIDELCGLLVQFPVAVSVPILIKTLSSVVQDHRSKVEKSLKTVLESSDGLMFYLEYVKTIGRGFVFGFPPAPRTPADIPNFVPETKQDDALLQSLLNIWTSFSKSVSTAQKQQLLPTMFTCLFSCPQDLNMIKMTKIFFADAEMVLLCHILDHTLRLLESRTPLEDPDLVFYHLLPLLIVKMLPPFTNEYDAIPNHWTPGPRDRTLDIKYLVYHLTCHLIGIIQDKQAFDQVRTLASQELGQMPLEWLHTLLPHKIETEADPKSVQLYLSTCCQILAGKDPSKHPQFLINMVPALFKRLFVSLDPQLEYLVKAIIDCGGLLLLAATQVKVDHFWIVFQVLLNPKAKFEDNVDPKLQWLLKFYLDEPIQNRTAVSVTTSNMIATSCKQITSHTKAKQVAKVLSDKLSPFLLHNTNGHHALFQLSFIVGADFWKPQSLDIVLGLLNNDNLQVCCEAMKLAGLCLQQDQKT